jgi:hypothetical protein
MIQKAGVNNTRGVAMRTPARRHHDKLAVDKFSFAWHAIKIVDAGLSAARHNANSTIVISHGRPLRGVK